VIARSVIAYVEREVVVVEVWAMALVRFLNRLRKNLCPRGYQPPLERDIVRADA
jgi:hypothetical protein